jgi:hypothetical protein
VDFSANLPNILILLNFAAQFFVFMCCEKGVNHDLQNKTRSECQSSGRRLRKKIKMQLKNGGNK